MPINKKSDLPDTIQRSPQKAQRTFAKAHDSALETYDGDERRAHRAAYSALKHSYEKVGDRWKPKDGKGPSDERAKKGGPGTKGRTAGGVDAEGHSKEELYERAQDLDVSGRSSMSKQELAEAIARKQD